MSYPLALLLFFVSGAIGLGYQVLWSKYLLAFIGASAYSYSTVLAAFMAGLAIGSALFGRIADRSRSPLRLFARLEAGIALYALLYPRLNAAAAAAYGNWVAGAPESSTGVPSLLAKAVTAGALLLPPTILMGGTYPAVVRHIARTLGQVGPRAAWAYSVNAAGAVLGSLAMAFALLPTLGLSSSLKLLALAGVVVAVCAYVFSLRHPPPLPAAGDPAAPEPPSTLSRNATAFAAVAGGVGFAYEVAWTRYFTMVLGSSTYSFAVMLAAFISGIALGSAILARRGDRLGHPVRVFGWIQMAASLVVLAALPLYSYLPWVVLQWSAVLSVRPAAFYVYEAGKLALCYLVMLPAATLLGMSLPLLLRGLVGRVERLGRDAGRVYAWNTWGSVATALVAGLLLLPRVGTEHLIRITALTGALAGFLAVWSHLPEAPDARRRSRVIAVMALGLVLLGQPLLPSWRPEWFMLAPFRRGEARSLAATREHLAGIETLMFEDDPAAHVFVARRPRGLEEERFLIVDGKPDASSKGDMPTQLLCGHLPLLLAPHAQDALLVGLGSGATAGAMLAHPLRRLEVVEIVGRMPEAARHFKDLTGDPLSDARLRLVIDDGRSYLAHATRSYDLIVSEPSNPWRSGVSNLFSADFYRTVQSKLRPRGVFLQWLQAYEMGDATFAAVLRTFQAAFPHVVLFQGGMRDMFLIGTREPLVPDWSQLSARIALPRVKEHLSQLEIQDVPGLLALQIMSPAATRYAASLAATINTDDNLYLEHRCPRDLFERASVTLPTRFDERLVAARALLFWRFLSERPNEHDVWRTLTSLTARAPVAVRAGWMAAAYHLSSGGLAQLSGSQLALLPPSYISDPPQAPAALAEKISRLAAQGTLGAASAVVGEHRPSILVESALSPELGRMWVEHARRWRLDGQDGRTGALRGLRIELLAATGDTAAAAADLEGWVRAAVAPEAEWAAFTACRLETALCAELQGRVEPIK